MKGSSGRSLKAILGILTQWRCKRRKMNKVAAAGFEPATKGL